MSPDCINRQWLLRRHPVGRLAEGDLQLHLGEMPVPADGQLLVRVLLVAMDPAIRAFLSPRPGYRPAVAPGLPVTGMVLGEVLASRCPGRLPGELVSGFGSWSDHVVGPGSQFAPVPLDLGREHELAAYTHVLGTSGLTAHHDAEGPVPGPPNLWNLIVHGASMQGFRIGSMLSDHVRTRETLSQIDRWIRDDRLRYDIDLREGFEQIPQAFAALSTGQHHGRLVVRINTRHPNPSLDHPVGSYLQ